MYYLIKPDQNFEWSEFSERDVEKFGIELEKLPWESSDRKLDPTTLRLALRNGTAVTRGIAVTLSAIDPRDRLVELLGIKSRDSSSLPGTDLMEYLMPGWKETGRALDEKIDAQRKKMIDEARDDLLEALAKPADDILVEHWKSLGGVILDPA